MSKIIITIAALNLIVGLYAVHALETSAADKSKGEAVSVSADKGQTELFHKVEACWAGFDRLEAGYYGAHQVQGQPDYQGIAVTSHCKRLMKDYAKSQDFNRAAYCIGKGGRTVCEVKEADAALRAKLKQMAGVR